MFNSVLARRLAAVAGMAVLTACASSGATSSTPGGDRYTITAAELANAGADNLYQAIEKLRPDFFRQRGNTMAAGASVSSSSRGNGPPPEASSTTANAVAGGALPLKVYQNDTMLMGTEDLRQIPLASVLEVKFVPGPQAGVRYGTNHSGGVILVRTKS
jgi:hypothetical protein